VSGPFTNGPLFFALGNHKAILYFRLSSVTIFKTFMVLQVPPYAKTYDLTNSTIWFDEDGILYSLPKPGPVKEPTTEDILLEMEKFRGFIGDKKVCMIAETAPSVGSPPKKEQRQLIAREIAAVTKAMAVITSSPLTKMVINLFYGFAPPKYPVKIFKTEAEARDWIKNYL
jgi:hypothetical protein